MATKIDPSQPCCRKVSGNQRDWQSGLAPAGGAGVVPIHVEAEANQPQVLSCNDCDNTIRWRDGERLHHLFEKRCEQFEGNDAIVTDDVVLTYRDLDNRANQLARHLIRQGIKSGDRVGLLFDRTVETYVALLAVLKINAAYVPLDPGFPTERMGFIVADAGLKAIISLSAFGEKLKMLAVRHVLVDAAKFAIDLESCIPISDGEVARPADQVCYIIYTSGTTGNPKGVVIEHPSICNFVRVASEQYGFAPGDRVYQGMTIAFDFSIEEVWVPLMAGATLVPGKQGASLVGNELSEFLRLRRVTCLCCCPTLLATIEDELPELRILLVGGEACPPNLVKRWHRPGRTILNSYGPTEATVTATLTELTPNKPVTIGRPLPTYTVVILDPAKAEVMESGGLGEIGLAGIGLAAGYLNRNELTEQKFIPDFLGIASNPSRRIYRTGDLGRINSNGEIEYHGRIDTQVKIRGYRIETAEIESVLLGISQITQAAVGTYEPEPGMVELVAYYALKQGASLTRSDIVQALRSRLPAYMIPAFVEELAFIPMLISNKADHKKLPKPKGQRFSVGKTVVEPATENERALSRALADVLKVKNVSIEDHFFNDLGAHSLLMARFCAKVRRISPMSGISMQDIYQNPTIAKLAGKFDDAANACDEYTTVVRKEPFHVPSDLSYYGCGAVQLLFYAGYGLLYAWIAAVDFSWTYAAIGSPFDLYWRSIAVAIVTFVGLSALPIAAKWLLIGKWKSESIPIWSLRYFRFWVVKTLIQTSPMAAFAGSPLYNFYLRWLGARIGRNAVISARFVPICTDLLSVGDNTVVRKDSILLGYRAQSNFIHTGPIEIGNHAFVGEASVLDIDTVMGHRTQLGHASSLQSGQRVPAGKHYHGSPAVETKSDYCPIESKNCSSLRRGLYAAFQLAGLFGIAVPLPIMVLNHLYPLIAWVGGASASSPDLPISALAVLMLLATAGTLFGPLVAGLAGVYAIPRICNLFLKPDKTYVLYGVHYWLQSVVAATSNSRFYNLLFGDSSVIIHYMRFVGWKLNQVEQTGSNFGTNQRHDNPFLCEIGSRTMVSDGLSMINLHMSSSSFRLNRTRIGESNYLGNDIHYPPNGRTGANCLLGTKVMIPIDGVVRKNVGLLGSPSFEIPRMVERDKNINAALSEENRRRRIGQKNGHNLLTALMFLMVRAAFIFVTIVVSQLAILNYGRFGVLSLFASIGFLAVFAVAFFVLIERASLSFSRLTPKTVSIYEPYFWAHERHWKLSDSPITERFGGTPFKNMVSALIGVKVGRKVYDAGCSITDRSLTEIGDCANLNEGSVLQAHSLEEGVFKSDYIRVGEAASLGVGAFVHYGVTMGAYVIVDADSFLMKGEVPDPHSVWRGNPAKPIGVDSQTGRVTSGLVKSERSLDDAMLELNVARVAAE